MPSVNYGMENGTLQKASATENKEFSGDLLHSPELKKAIAEGNVEEFSKILHSQKLDRVKIRKMITDTHKKKLRLKKTTFEPAQDLPILLIPVGITAAIVGVGSALAYDILQEKEKIVPSIANKKYISAATNSLKYALSFFIPYSILCFYTYICNSNPNWQPWGISIHYPKYDYDNDKIKELLSIAEYSVLTNNDEK